VAVVALNTAASADPITYSLSGTGTPSGATVTPYLTNASSDTAAQAASTVSGGAFTATIPARSLVTYVIPASAGGGGGTPTPTPTPTPTGSPTPTPTPSPTVSSGSCQVTYTTQSQWAGGFVANVTITNPGSSAISGWTLGFSFPGDQKITNAWSGSVTQSGASVSITSASYNATLAAGSSVSLGFQGTWTSSDAAPVAFTLNRTPCNL
jgi:hypothetical protein